MTALEEIRSEANRKEITPDDLKFPRTQLTRVQATEQLTYKLEHKRLCFSRAMDAFNIHDANVFCAQIEWIESELLRLAQTGKCFRYSIIH